MNAASARNFFPAGCALMVLLALPGRCEAGQIHSIKFRGVYTTMITPEVRPLSSFAMPSSGYDQHEHFGPDEVPVAVILGYGGFDVTLTVVDLTTGESLKSVDTRPGRGRAVLQPLLITRSGEYEVRLVVKGKRHDSFKFTVMREALTTDQGKFNYDALIAHANSRLQVDPEDGLAFSIRGSAQLGKGQLDEAIKDYTETIRLRPNDATAHVLRAGVLSRERKWDKAIADFDEFSRMRPEDPRGVFGRAVINERRGNFDQAVSDLRKAIQIQPEYARACNELAWLLATCPEARYRNGKEAVTLATKYLFS